MSQFRQDTLSRIESSGVVAVIRADIPDQLLDICKALRDAGDIGCEITMTVPGALDAIAATRAALGDSALIGVGSVLDAATAEKAIAAGAQFVFSPTFDPQVIAAAKRHGRVVVPGALTPTEIQNAWEAGADMVKIFPANHFGPRYIRDLHGPMPHLKLTPTGGVNLDTVSDWIKAGAAAVGAGSSLVRKDLIAERNWAELTKLARQFIDAVTEARADQ